MKKYFYILTMAGCLSLINGTNNANAVQSESVIVTYTCPYGCELVFNHGSDGVTFAGCNTPEGEKCDDPEVVISSIAPNVNQPMSEINKVKAKKKTVSARSAETPKMVKKIVYEQVVEEDED